MHMRKIEAPARVLLQMKACAYHVRLRLGRIEGRNDRRAAKQNGSDHLRNRGFLTVQSTLRQSVQETITLLSTEEILVNFQNQ